MTNSFQTLSPIDGSVYVERDYATQAEIEHTFRQAKAAQISWRESTIDIRQNICHKMVDAFIEQKSVIAEQLCWMMGRPIRYAAMEIDGLAERARYMIDLAPSSLAPLKIPDKAGYKRYIKHEPLGVVMVIAPWNYPYLTAVNSIVPAIMAGNSVILKHSAQTPLCAEQFASAFDAAGLVRHVFQYLHLSHADTEVALRSQSINHVAFTGSVLGGKQVESALAGRFIHSGLELGGKDPAYVRADATLEHAVETCVDGAFFNSGQSCCGIERIYVAESIFDEFIDRASALIHQYKLGRSNEPNTTLGPMVNSSSADRIRLMIKEAMDAGAKPHIDSKSFELDRPSSPYLAPQMLTGVNHTMRLMTEECFGPVIGVMPVKDDDEAIRLMNDSDFGLTAAIFTQDLEKARELGERLEAGTVFVNRCDYLDPALAWVGVKESGRGCSLSKLGYQSLTRPKSFHIKSV